MSDKSEIYKSALRVIARDVFKRTVEGEVLSAAIQTVATEVLHDVGAIMEEARASLKMGFGDRLVDAALSWNSAQVEKGK